MIYEEEKERKIKSNDSMGLNITPQFQEPGPQLVSSSLASSILVTSNQNWGTHGIRGKQHLGTGCAKYDAKAWREVDGTSGKDDKAWLVKIFLQMYWFCFSSFSFNLVNFLTVHSLNFSVAYLLPCSGFLTSHISCVYKTPVFFIYFQSFTNSITDALNQVFSGRNESIIICVLSCVVGDPGVWDRSASLSGPINNHLMTGMDIKNVPWISNMTANNLKLKSCNIFGKLGKSFGDSIKINTDNLRRYCVFGDGLKECNKPDLCNFANSGMIESCILTEQLIPNEKILLFSSLLANSRNIYNIISFPEGFTYTNEFMEDTVFFSSDFFPKKITISSINLTLFNLKSFLHEANLKRILTHKDATSVVAALRNLTSTWACGKGNSVLAHVLQQLGMSSPSQKMPTPNQLIMKKLTRPPAFSHFICDSLQVGGISNSPYESVTGVCSQDFQITIKSQERKMGLYHQHSGNSVCILFLWKSETAADSTSDFCLPVTPGQKHRKHVHTASLGTKGPFLPSNAMCAHCLHFGSSVHHKTWDQYPNITETLIHDPNCLRDHTITLRINWICYALFYVQISGQFQNILHSNIINFCFTLKSVVKKMDLFQERRNIRENIEIFIISENLNLISRISLTKNSFCSYILFPSPNSVFFSSFNSINVIRSTFLPAVVRYALYSFHLSFHLLLTIFSLIVRWVPPAHQTMRSSFLTRNCYCLKSSASPSFPPFVCYRKAISFHRKGLWKVPKHLLGLIADLTCCLEPPPLKKDCGSSSLWVDWTHIHVKIFYTSWDQVLSQHWLDSRHVPVYPPSLRGSSWGSKIIFESHCFLLLIYSKNTHKYIELSLVLISTRHLPGVPSIRIGISECYQSQVLIVFLNERVGGEFISTNVILRKLIMCGNMKRRTVVHAWVEDSMDV
ncbi:hypothetical protein VP01_199g8 [Puccinia sorghi]|uniref:Uncharacterized protein n=1 Tax=Puccinia sorghi TaxID=27349 RepID=A0A0L6VBC3_9BASI|nr:hypothetical protein VP01_199g8 [Puccinia sorghi]